MRPSYLAYPILTKQPIWKLRDKTKHIFVKPQVEKLCLSGKGKPSIKIVFQDIIVPLGICGPFMIG